MSMVAQPDPQILESKLRRPWVRQGIVSRAALVDRLLASHRVPVVCVVAPAGYGKTTLLSQWAEQRGRAAWVSLDERDNDPEILLACAAAALNRVEAIRRQGVGGSSLTTAELRILPLLATHLTFREIAERLYLSPYTVKTQALSVYRKFGVSSRSAAIDRAHGVGVLGHRSSSDATRARGQGQRGP
jgi:ATP/maltotriose-dependent transcriptional regulator MalT